MAKNKSTVDDNDQYPSDNPVEEDVESVELKVGGKKEVILVHKRKTKKELHIGREIYTFWGCQSLSVPKEVVSHSDFKGQEKYFTVKEVK